MIRLVAFQQVEPRTAPQFDPVCERTSFSLAGAGNGHNRDSKAFVALFEIEMQMVQTAICVVGPSVPAHGAGQFAVLIPDFIKQFLGLKNLFTHEIDIALSRYSRDHVVQNALSEVGIGESVAVRKDDVFRIAESSHQSTAA